MRICTFYVKRRKNHRWYRCHCRCCRHTAHCQYKYIISHIIRFFFYLFSTLFRFSFFCVCECERFLVSCKNAVCNTFISVSIFRHFSSRVCFFFLSLSSSSSSSSSHFFLLGSFYVCLGQAHGTFSHSLGPSLLSLFRVGGNLNLKLKVFKT